MKREGLIVIPTYNERENIQQLIPQLLDIHPGLDILVVDDNSPDQTADVVRQFQRQTQRVKLLERPAKMGLGTAYTEGFRFALAHDYPLVFEMDADFSHNPEDIPRFLEAIEDADLVIGSRYKTGVNVVNWPISRLLLSYFANMYTRIITRMPVYDATSGFKCFRTEILRLIDLDSIHSNGYAFQIEMNYKVWKAGGRIKEIPIIFIDRRSGESKMSKDIVWEAAWIVWKLRLFYRPPKTRQPAKAVQPAVAPEPPQ